MSPMGLVKRHPLGVFLAWFFTVGQALAFIPAFTGLPSQPFLIAATFVGLLVPAIAITRMVHGPEGLRALRRRTFLAHVPARCFGFAVIVVPAITIAATVIVAGPPPAGGASGLVLAATLGYAVSLLAVLVTVNWWEEVAWMGIVQAGLQGRHGAMRAAIITGVAFGLGHISLAVGEGGSAAITLTLLLVAVSIPFRALQAWIYNRTDSLLLVGLVHAAANAVADGSVLGDGFLPRLYGDTTTSGLVFPVLALIGLVAIIATRAKLGDPQARSHPTDPVDQPAACAVIPRVAGNPAATKPRGA